MMMDRPSKGTFAGVPRSGGVVESPPVVVIAVALVAAGLLLNILGAIMFSWGDLRSTAALVRYYGSGEGKEVFDAQVRRMPWWRRRVLVITQKYGPADLLEMQQEPVLEAFPRQALGLLILVLGSSLQVVGAFVALWR